MNPSIYFKNPTIILEYVKAIKAKTTSPKPVPHAIFNPFDKDSLLVVVITAMLEARNGTAPTAEIKIP